MAKTFKNFNHQLRELTKGTVRSKNPLVEEFFDDLDDLDDIIDEDDDLTMEETLNDIETNERVTKLTRRKKSEYL